MNKTKCLPSRDLQSTRKDKVTATVQYGKSLTEMFPSE